ncbi:MAG: hypothetical protein ACLP7Q_00690 [Isosphaeraceae bacterium]
MTTELENKLRELDNIKAKLEQLENEVAAASLGPGWRATSYYGAYYATAGCLLGIVAALVSLAVNLIGAPLAGKSPLELIRVYLTFPLGEKALQLTQGQMTYAVNDRVIVTLGLTLYLLTGMILGIPVYIALSRLAAKDGLGKRLIVASVVSLLIWLVMFYGILSWLQPLLVEGNPGNWITNNAYLPWWVAAATHLVFGWTIALLYPLGEYHPYHRLTESAA